MGLILNSILITVAVTVVGGSIGYFIWLQLRPKKETWVAEIWGVSDTFQGYPRDEQGRIIQKIRLKDMVMLGLDTLEKVTKKGQTIYRLQKIKRTTPPVETGTTYRRGNKVCVQILKFGETYTLFKRGYSEDIGKAVIKPLPYSTINQIETNIIEKESRNEKDKTVWEAVTPFIVTGIMAMSLVACAYFMGGAFIKISKSFQQSMNEVADKMTKMVDKMAEIQAINIRLLEVQTGESMKDILGRQKANATTS